MFNAVSQLYQQFRITQHPVTFGYDSYWSTFDSPYDRIDYPADSKNIRNEIKNQYFNQHLCSLSLSGINIKNERGNKERNLENGWWHHCLSPEETEQSHQRKNWNIVWIYRSRSSATWMPPKIRRANLKQSTWRINHCGIKTSTKIQAKQITCSTVPDNPLKRTFFRHGILTQSTNHHRNCNSIKIKYRTWDQFQQTIRQYRYQTFWWVYAWQRSTPGLHQWNNGS